MELKLCLLFIILKNSLAQELYGASVNWRPTSNNSISVSYHFIWRGNNTLAALQAKCNSTNQLYNITRINLCIKGFDDRFKGGLLSVKDPKIVPPIFPGYNLLCIRGCHTPNQIVTNLSKLYFTEASSFLETEWESGVGTADLTFDLHDDKENVRLGFEDQNGTLVDGLGEAYLSMAIRNDTNRPNISPVVNVLPVYRVPLGCNITIRLFPFDGDGDKAVCQWQTYPKENNPSSSAFLNSHACEIIFTAKRGQFKEGDVINLTLYAEDYSSSLVEFTGASRYITSGPFCKIPIKLRIFVGNSTASCQSNGPNFFGDGTLSPYFKKSYEMDFFKSGYTAQLPFMTNNETDRILTSGPRFMIFVNERNITLRTTGEWYNIIDITMKGIHQACGMAYALDGTPGESRCGVLMLFEPDECSATINPCGKEGVCHNFFEHFTCSYSTFNVTENMSQSGTCKTGITTEKGNDGLKIGLPVGLFLLLLLLLIALTLYLKHKWTEKMQTVDVGDKTPISTITEKAI